MAGAVLAAIIAVVILAVYLVTRLRADEGLDTYYDMSEGERYPHKWGYVDTRFEFEDPRNVRVTGSRYPLAGYRMPQFVPFIEDVLGVPLSPDSMNVEKKDQEVPAPKANEAFLASVEEKFKDLQFSLDPEDRLIHSHGQLSVDEIYRTLYRAPLDRVVDMVFYPEGEADVKEVVLLAKEHNVCLIPYGGGTNVSGALLCPADEQRMIVSVDMRRMNRILWLDEENLQACIEAGISGKQMERELDAKGYTSGHDPDSVELSTLGGWISTNASGMKKNKYGNIEDIVVEATLVTPTGDIETKSVTPRSSTGVQPKFFLFGSEGNFGIITKAVIKIHPRPQVRKYGSLAFPSFEKGVAFLKDLRQNGILPASIRLVNNNEFRFGMALRREPTLKKKITGGIQDFFLHRILGFKEREMVACTIVMEGSKREVRQQKKSIFGIAKGYGGISGGAAKGKRGYMLTFGIAYIRDFCNTYHMLGETFETSVPWGRIHPVCRAVEEKLADLAAEHQVPGTPYLGYRVTQTYHTGVCIYFTMGFYEKGLEKPDEVFHHIEHSLRQVILDNGGSLSHHHGVGKIRQGFLPQIQTENSIHVLRQAKKAMDPGNIFGAGNGIFGEIS